MIASESDATLSLTTNHRRTNLLDADIRPLEGGW
jgi:hypothetical protein